MQQRRQISTVLSAKLTLCRARCHYKQFNLELQLIVTSTEELLFFHMAKPPARGRTSSS